MIKGIFQQIIEMLGKIISKEQLHLAYINNNVNIKAFSANPPIDPSPIKLENPFYNTNESSIPELLFSIDAGFQLAKSEACSSIVNKIKEKIVKFETLIINEKVLKDQYVNDIKHFKTSIEKIKVKDGC